MCLLHRMDYRRLIIRSTKKSAWNWPVLLLLFLALGASEISSVHNLIHKKETAELHTALNETDPCHISVYHYQRNTGCDHDAHLIKEDTCSFCDLQLPSSYFLEAIQDVSPITFNSIFDQNSFEPSVAGIIFQPTGRAPPVV